MLQTLSFFAFNLSRLFLVAEGLPLSLRYLAHARVRSMADQAAELHRRYCARYDKDRSVEGEDAEVEGREDTDNEAGEESEEEGEVSGEQGGVLEYWPAGT